MNKRYLLFIAPLLLATSPIRADFSSNHVEFEAYDAKPVGKIDVEVMTLQRSESFNSSFILSKLRTKQGDPFNQLTFDQDLKELSESYERVEPEVQVQDGKVNILLKIWQKPLIHSIRWHGNTQIKTKTLQKKLGIKPFTTFNRDEFTKAFNTLREYYIKKGYFEVNLSYRIIHNPENNTIDIIIDVDEGHTGRIKALKFYGFSKQEQSALLHMINTKKYNLVTSWITGQGTYHEEMIEHDKLIITNYLQNEGYADASVEIRLYQDANKRLVVEVEADKGEKYEFGDISFKGNILYDDYKLQESIPIKDGSVFSPEKLRSSVEILQDLYGKDGYIDTNIRYTLVPDPASLKYNVIFDIQEGKQYRVGLIRVLGNTSTKPNVILRESLLVPGEVFDSRKLKATQQRLQAIGYFKSVNVYSVQTKDDEALGEDYRDVIIEVEETTTGSLSLFFGLSSADSIFGGVELSESNFNIAGLPKIFKDGFKSIRGNGEYASVKAQIGAKQSDYSISWMTPYLRDTLWRFGFDANYAKVRLQTNDYKVDTLGGSIFASYPLNPYWTYGMKTRVRNAIVNVDGSAGQQALAQERNSGLVYAYSNTIAFDSTDNAFKPHRGFRSSLEAEIAGVTRHDENKSTFPFVRFSYLNSYYYPVWRLGTLKTRADLKFLQPFGDGTALLLPLSERFFLGGEASVRGYKPFSLGPKFEKIDAEGNVTYTDDPTGGVSSTLLSIEYLQQLHRMIDVFVFFDAGSVSLRTYDINKFNMSYGVGLRVDIGNRLPITVGIGFPINPDRDDDVQKVFFSMGGQF